MIWRNANYSADHLRVKSANLDGAMAGSANIIGLLE
jgi:hypothetical protein